MKNNNFALQSNHFGLSFFRILRTKSFRFLFLLIRSFSSFGTFSSSDVSFSLLLLRARYCVSHEQKLSASSSRPETFLLCSEIVDVVVVVRLIRPSRRLTQEVLCQLFHSPCGNSLVRCYEHFSRRRECEFCLFFPLLRFKVN